MVVNRVSLNTHDEEEKDLRYWLSKSLRDFLKNKQTVGRSQDLADIKEIQKEMKFQETKVKRKRKS